MAKCFDLKSKEVFNDKSGQKPSPEQLLALAEYALTHGLNDKFVDVMKKMAADNPTHPAVVAFLKVQADLDRPVTKDDSAAGRRGSATVSGRPRPRTARAIISSSTTWPPFTRTRCRSASRLEDSLRTFYYWFALKGIALPVRPSGRSPC